MRVRKLLFCLLLLCGLIGVVSTYQRLSLTADENFHVRCGMEWWRQGTYTIESLHPPLARLMDAAPLYWAQKLTDGQVFTGLSPRDAYLERITLVRLGSLPFYLLSCVLVFLWSKRLFGEESALWSLALYAFLSPVTAHAALATTDMGYTAMFILAIMASLTWLQTPSWRNAGFMGAAAGLMVGAKFSSLVQWPAAMALILLVQILANRKLVKNTSPITRKHLETAILASWLFALMLACIYRFSMEPFLAGIRMLRGMNHRGFAIWLFHPLWNQAVWYFFPVVFFFKTPLPFHAAAIIGNGRIARRFTAEKIEQLFPLLAALGVMLVSMTSMINLGVRHVLPLYPLLAIPAGYGLASLWQAGGWKRLCAGALLLWQIGGFLIAHPDHISDFNMLAGPRPEHISLDSDFDWGQGVVLLDEELQSQGAKQVHVCLRPLGGTFDNTHKLLHAEPLDCDALHATGWIAVSRSNLMFNRSKFYPWLNSAIRIIKVGNILVLYYIKPEEP